MNDMQKRLLPVAVLALLVAGAVSAAFTSGGGDSDGGVTYDVTVTFDTSVTQADLDAVAAVLRPYDEDGSFLVQESFPPVARAQLTTDAPDFCATVEAALEAVHAVVAVSCGVAQEALAGDPDEPVTSGDLVDPEECSLVHNVEACDDGGAPGQPPVRSDEGIPPDECNYVHNIEACEDGGAPGEPVVPPDGDGERECDRANNIEDCVKNAPLVPSEPDSGDGTPVTSADGIAPDECSRVHNIEAC